MEKEVNNILMMLIKLMISFADAKSVLKHLWKTLELHEQQTL
jgi:hypothetical protein